MNNLRRDLDEIDGLISQIQSAPLASNRYIYAKKLRTKIDELVKRLVQEENDLVKQELRKYDK